MEHLATRFEKQVFQVYLDSVKSRHHFHPRFKEVEDKWASLLTAADLIKGPFLEKAQSYQSGGSHDSLDLSPPTLDCLTTKLGKRSLFFHQHEAIKKVGGGRNVVVATGTSSGKTLCYQLPIIEDLARNPGSGLRAVIIYPLNALVNDQLAEWESLLSNHPTTTYGRFTGQTPKDQAEYISLQKKRFRAQGKANFESESDLDRYAAQRLREENQKDELIRSNRLNHRDAIRSTPPNILITNFSMLEYLLERPIDASIFDGARLKFLVLDEVHAYRGPQATELALLIRRIKERLGIRKLSCIATSATLGSKEQPDSVIKVSRFASQLFDSTFEPSDIIYGTMAEPILAAPGMDYTPDYYEELSANLERAASHVFESDRNLYRLKKDILIRPILLKDAAERLWPGTAGAERGLQALLEMVAIVDSERPNEEALLPTRLHYFLKTQDGLYVCLNPECPGRHGETPAYFMARSREGTPRGHCPDCDAAGRTSLLVEVVTCKRCGYVYGTLQDMAPSMKASQSGKLPNLSERSIHWDSFTTELGWAADAYYTYFSISPEMPYPGGEDELDLISGHKGGPLGQIKWCASCGKKIDQGAGDVCQCSLPVPRELDLVWRQCPIGDVSNLESGVRTSLDKCPNCQTPSNGGFEPLRRLQESDDESGLAMAIPLANFKVTGDANPEPPKLLTFADNRQRAASFPTLVEEESFDRAIGQKIIEIVKTEPKGITFLDLGDRLYQMTRPESPSFDPNFRLPVSRIEEDEDRRAGANDWYAETFGYFAIPDAARDSAEDVGLIRVEYSTSQVDNLAIRAIFAKYGISADAADAAFQFLAGFMRRRKAFTLPPGKVAPDAPAFGNVTVEIGFKKEADPSDPNKQGWLPKGGENSIVRFLKRLLAHSAGNPESGRDLAEDLWNLLTQTPLLKDTGRDTWKLYHDHLLLKTAENRFVCATCGQVTSYSAAGTCPNHRCNGVLQAKSFDDERSSLVKQWRLSPSENANRCLVAEEHTAQINKEDAKAIEDAFRADGVNLLSSTTTFEMGISIGDLMKVLLRNAPPTSASYVQRIGRAGRGRNKNAVCVTLCRRTKYDLDQWNDPARLMSGTINPAMVFMGNAFIAQRHVNAMVFAQFLGDLAHQSPQLGLSQKVALEGFLNTAARRPIPQNLKRLADTVKFDYLSWVSGINLSQIAVTDAGQAVLRAAGGTTDSVKHSTDTFKQILTGIEAELADLLTERARAEHLGNNTTDFNISIKALLDSSAIDVLAKRGFLPRYAFPLDVVSLETNLNRWIKTGAVDLARDRGLAIAEFAPGAQVVARKRVYTSEGLYKIGDKTDLDPHYFSECPGCGQIRTAKQEKDLKGPCDVCKTPSSRKVYTQFIEPQAFSVRIQPNKQSGERFRRSRLVRQRQPITHFIDNLPSSEFADRGSFSVGLKNDGLLFRYNSGPGHMGFAICKSCGFSRSMKEAGGRSKLKHDRLRYQRGEKKDCTCTEFFREIAFGHRFKTFCLVIRPKFQVRSPYSLAYALQRGVMDALEVETNDIGVAIRHRADLQAGQPPEIVLYDLTSGGSGFCEAALAIWGNVLAAAVAAMQACDCAHSCYNCLKSYSNQSFHDSLDRHLAISDLQPNLRGAQT